jgi:hypothetical protein
LDFLFAPHNLVFFAGAISTIAYLIINQAAMRIALLVATAFYIWYYFSIANTPLWEAIYTSSIMAGANLLGLAFLFGRKSKLAIPAQHRDIYPLFDELLPGDFRALVKTADRVVLDDALVLAHEGEAVDQLYYVISGTMTVSKLGNSFRLPPEVFVGEVAFLTGRPATATTTLPEGAEVLVWDVARLRKLAAKKARFKMALEAVISQDLALKVSSAVAPSVSEDMMAARPLWAGRVT